jgi:hypothetical protein
MARHRGHFPCFIVYVNRMAAALTKKAAAMFFQVANQINAFHT